MQKISARTDFATGAFKRLLLVHIKVCCTLLRITHASSSKSMRNQTAAELVGNKGKVHEYGRDLHNLRGQICTT